MHAGYRQQKQKGKMFLDRITVSHYTRSRYAETAGLAHMRTKWSEQVKATAVS